jgi:hypothetical protein
VSGAPLSRPLRPPAERAAPNPGAADLPVTYTVTVFPGNDVSGAGYSSQSLRRRGEGSGHPRLNPGDWHVKTASTWVFGLEGDGLVLTTHAALLPSYRRLLRSRSR